MSDKPDQPQPATLYPEKPAPTEHAIDDVIARRWSPRLFAEGRPVERERIVTLLEAARWAPSCFNEQPWRYLVFDGSDEAAMERARACLVAGNAWALKAPMLMISIARDNFTHNDTPNRTAQHDVGMASENLVLEAVRLGLVAHQMAGFDVERARREFNIPEDYTVLAMIAVGYPYRDSLDDLDEQQRAKELAPRTRKAISEIAYAGTWDAPYDQ
jgi:nitroreductase